jgi:methionine synthase I (cobalamin-dependent)
VLIKGIHSSSLAAGATVLTTNTFAANSVELAAAGIDDQTVEINQAAVQLAHEAIAEYKSEYAALDTDFFVIGSIGPGGVESMRTQLKSTLSLKAASTQYFLKHSQTSILR